MIGLLGLVLFLQLLFNWLIMPFEAFLTPIFEGQGLAISVLLFGVWVFSGPSNKFLD